MTRLTSLRALAPLRRHRSRRCVRRNTTRRQRGGGDDVDRIVYVVAGTHEGKRGYLVRHTAKRVLVEFVGDRNKTVRSYLRPSSIQQAIRGRTSPTTKNASPPSRTTAENVKVVTLDGTDLFDVPRPVHPDTVVRLAKEQHGLHVDVDILRDLINHLQPTDRLLAVPTVVPQTPHVFKCTGAGVLPEIALPAKSASTTIIIDGWRHYDRAVDGEKKKVGHLRALFDETPANTNLYTLEFTNGHMTTPMVETLFEGADARRPGLFPRVEKLVLGECDLGSEKAITLLAQVLRAHPQLRVLNISRISIQHDGHGIQDICSAVARSKITSLDMSHAQLNEKPGKALADMLAATSVLKELNVSHRGSLEVDDGPDFAQELAVGLGANKSLVKFDISKNHLCAGGAEALAKALHGNQIMTELNIASNTIGNESTEWGADSDLSGVVAIRDAIPTMGALSKLIFGDEPDDDDADDDDEYHPAILETGMTEADLSNKGLGAGGAIIVGAWISHKDHGALTSLNVSANEIPPDEMENIITIAESKPTLQTLCGVPFKDTTLTALDLSGKNLGADGAMVVCRYIHTNGALASLNVSSNNMASKDTGKAMAEALAHNSVLKELDVSSNLDMTSDGFSVRSGDGPGFAQELAVGLKNNRALVKFDISDNIIGAGGCKALAGALKYNTNIKELNIAGNYVSYDADDRVDTTGMIAICDVIPTMEALVKFDISNNALGSHGFQLLAESLRSHKTLTELNVAYNEIKGAEAGKALGDALAANTVLKELNLSHNFSGPAFAKEFSVGLGANGALTSLNISNNEIGRFTSGGWTYHPENVDLAKYIHADGRRHGPQPPAGEEFKPEGVTALADAIRTNRAMTSLNVSNNDIRAEGTKTFAEAFKNNQTMTKLDISSNNIGNWGEMSGITAISDAIPTMGALTSLKVSNNNLSEVAQELITGVCRDKDIHLHWR